MIGGCGEPGKQSRPGAGDVTFGPRNDTASVGREFIGRTTSYLIDSYWPRLSVALQRLSDEDLWWRPNDASNSAGNLVLHLCGNARQWIVSGVGGG
jgi:hypothetical protein